MPNPSTNINKSLVSTILRQLMDESGIKEAELARQVNLPQTTINRVLLGGTADPRANTLKPLADYFGVTIGQLCGFESLSPHRMAGVIHPTKRSAWISIPIIEWDKVQSWKFDKKNITPLTHQNWITSERDLSEDAFALYSLASMEPRFRKGSVLIIDPQLEYKDGHFVVVALDGIHPTVRRIVIDGSDTLLKAFDQTSSIKLEKSHVIYGTIVESRMDVYHG